MKAAVVRALPLVLLNAGILILLAIPIHQNYFERPFLYYQPSTFKVVGGPFRAGDVVPLLVTRCNRDSEQHHYGVSHSVANLENGESTVLPSVFVSIEPGCRTAISRINALPNDLEPGRYRIVGGSEVAGRLRTLPVTWQSEPFDVVR